MSDGILPGQQHYIFFLQLNRQLPPFYQVISEYLSCWNIKLIPVSRSSLAELDKGQNKYLLTIVTDMASLNKYRQIQKEYLNFALLGQKYCLFEMTSFSPNSLIERLRRFDNYHHFPLPVEVEAACQGIARKVFKDSKVVEKWPGGRRGKFPFTDL
ncbi:MAG: hypothetical protein ISR65_14080 [Bacteriovoracaceae bacterium]|nr:hypothetical protein [Bacteriovoracaceae bacterium]